MTFTEKLLFNKDILNKLEDKTQTKGRYLLLKKTFKWATSLIIKEIEI